MRSLAAIIIPVTLSTASCAFTPQAVYLRPQLPAMKTSVGQGKAVAVTVVDERPRSTLGTRGAKGVGADITLKEDLASMLRPAVADSLRQRGFNPVIDKPADGRELRIEVRTLDYTLTQGLLAGNLRTECSLKAVCILGHTRPYENFYRGEHTQTALVIPSGSANEAYINDAVSKALEPLLQDSELMQCLAH